MGMSDYLENKDLDLWYGRSGPAMPTNTYVQLHTADPGETGTSAVHASFARVLVANNTTNWPAASGGVKQNGLKISFGTTAGLTGLANVTHVSIWDAASGGNCLDYGALDASLNPSDRLEVAFQPGALKISRT